MTAGELERDFATRGTLRGGLLLLRTGDALALVRRARAERIPVLGIDGFLLVPGSTRPDPAAMLDLSDAPPPADPWSHAEAFLERRLGSGLHFDVVLGDPRRPVRAAAPARRAIPVTADVHPLKEAGMEVELTQEHRWLERLVGEWTSEMEAAMKPGDPPETFTGTESVRSLDGAWVLCEGRGEMPGGGATTTIMTLGYDTAKGRYVGTFIGTMSTYMWIYEGALDAGGDALTLDTQGPSFTDQSRMAKYRDTIEFRGDDHRVLSSSMQGEDGSWQQIMEVHYRRAG